MRRPLLLDLFCKAGGAARGYHQAGFDVVGVDIAPQPNYPYIFVQGDALEVLPRLLSALPVAAVHASPPCQWATVGNRALRAAGKSTHLNLIPPTRDILEQSGLPYVIENVVSRLTLAEMRDPVMLCGRQFHLGAVDTDGEWLTLDRHRLFESNVVLETPPTCRPHNRKIQVGGVYGGARRDKVEARTIRKGGYVPKDVDVLRALLGIPWMDEAELYEAIPPAYTAYLGRQLLEQVAECAA